MKTIKILALITLTAMTFSLGKAEEGYDCDGTVGTNCHPSNTQTGIYFCGGAGCYSNCTEVDGDGSGDIQTCSSSSDNQGLCNPNGTVPCSYNVTITAPDGTVLVNQPNSMNPAPTTYTCNG